MAKRHKILDHFLKLNRKYKMKINAETPNCTNILLYAAFSSIPLDIEGSNIDFVGWIPSEEDKKYMPLDVYEAEKKKGEEQNAKIIFKNVKTQWDSCDCGGGYPCSIEVKNEDQISNNLNSK